MAFPTVDEPIKLGVMFHCGTCHADFAVPLFGPLDQTNLFKGVKCTACGDHGGILFDQFIAENSAPQLRRAVGIVTAADMNSPAGPAVAAARTAEEIRAGTVLKKPPAKCLKCRKPVVH